MLRRLRNGLAHAHLDPVNKEGQWDSVKIWNWAPLKGVKKGEKAEVTGKLKELNIVYRDTGDQGDQIEVKDLEIEFTWKQLYEFASRIADEHLKHYNQIRK